LVDGDQTLIVIGKRIYDAGFNWSSFIDGAIILLYGGLLGVAGYLVLGEPYLIAYYLVLACIGFFALASIPSQSKKHRKLCVDQQEHIRYFCRDRLVEEFRKGLHA